MKKNIFFGRNLEILMVVHRIERQELADYLDVTPQTIGKWINKNILPESQYMLPLCEKFSIDLEDLIHTDLEGEALKAIEATSEDNLIVREPGNNTYSIKAHLLSMQRHLNVMQDENNRAIDQFQ